MVKSHPVDTSANLKVILYNLFLDGWGGKTFSEIAITQPHAVYTAFTHVFYIIGHILLRQCLRPLSFSIHFMKSWVFAFYLLQLVNQHLAPLIIK